MTYVGGSMRGGVGELRNDGVYKVESLQTKFLNVGTQLSVLCTPLTLP